MSSIGDDRLQGKGDDFYEALMTAHAGLTLEESVRLNARLVLILANLVADPLRLKDAIKAAKSNVKTG